MNNFRKSEMVGKLVVLCVEDEDVIRSLVSVTLRNAGFTVTETATCAEATRAVQKEMPDIAILDVDLPDGNGFDLATELRHREKSSLPILMISGRDHLDCKQKAEALNAKFLPKPFGPLTLLTAVNSLEGVQVSPSENAKSRANQ